VGTTGEGLIIMANNIQSTIAIPIAERRITTTTIGFMVLLLFLS
jgi:hypothetical protein